MPFLATASQQGSSTTGMLILLLPLLLIGLLFWQQRRRQKQMQQVQSNLTAGQDVSTTSGLMGRLVEVGDQTVVIEAAPGVRLTFDKRAVLPASGVTGAQGGSAPRTDQADGASDPTPGEDTNGPDQPRQGA